MRARGALGQLPFVAEQVRKEVVAPLRRRRGPDDFEAAGDRAGPYAHAEFVSPAEALLLDARALPFGADRRRIAVTVGFAEVVLSRDHRLRLLVIHRHARER